MREYLPVHVIHEANCPDAPGGLPTFRADLIPAVHPNAKAHTCVSPETVKRNHEVVAEAGDAGDHRYEPSAAKPPDATRALCKHCSGTHGEVDLATWLRQR